MYVKNDNVYAKSWSVLGVGVWLFLECWSFVLTHMMEHSMSNMGRIRCGCCWASNSTGHRILSVGSDDVTPGNLKFLAISTYRSILGLAISFVCICLFEIDQYTDLFQHVDAAGSVALLCLFYALAHLAFINYDKFGQHFSFDWYEIS